MKKVLIRVKDIKNCWETKDACIVEQYDGKKWVCDKFYRNDNGEVFYYCWDATYSKTFDIVKNCPEDYGMIELTLFEKGKSDGNGRV